MNTMIYLSFTFIKKNTIAFFLLFFLFSPIIHFRASTQGNESALLVYTHNGKGYVHENISASVTALQKLGAQLGYRVDTTNSPSVFNRESLKGYQAIIFTNTNNEAFYSEDQRRAFQNFILQGGGFAGIHSATGSERKWEWYTSLIGASFLRHPPFQTYIVCVVDSSHPATNGIPLQWARADECYYFKNLQPGIKVLLAADLRTVNDPESKPTEYGDLYPAVWCQEFMGSRQWYTALGHSPSDYSDPVFLQHLENGLRWILRIQ